jgi:coproporphyrinogen III oxidase
MSNSNEIIHFLKSLRDAIISQFELYEEQARFERKPWQYHAGEGGGEISLMRGEAFEKAAVNWSGVSGKQFPMSDGEGPFFATGISLITHMRNPKAPTVHMNLRYIQTKKRQWFGGGYDLTPMGFPFEEDSAHFHQTTKKTLDAFDKKLYPSFAQAAAEYFYIPHWRKERGVGGIFFDHYDTGDYENDFQLWQAIGKTFLDAICPIIERRMREPFTSEDRATQLRLRAHYAEFNLLYDRGTRFGFASGGNPEAILCSMPPLAAW